MRIEARYNGAGRAYAFDCHVAVKVGDEVVVPGTWVSGNRPQRATVSSLSSSYSGPCAKVLRKDEA